MRGWLIVLRLICVFAMIDSIISLHSIINETEVTQVFSQETFDSHRP